MSSAASSSSSAIRRLPLRQALETLRSGEGSRVLPPTVRGVTFRFVAKDSEPGPRDFLRTIAPRLAYSNPSLPIRVDRIRDPRTKSKDPKSPDAGAQAWDDGVPSGEMVVELDGQEPRTISLSKLSASAILQELYTATGLASEEGSKPTPIGAELAEAARTVPPETSG
ncbi:hypothetical protein EHS25_002819 [Saitozyma podzolica]|uniref:Ribosomal protein/NADH dehydrogenase domain-containing protein n=1 Tax=Saitozyma podzolica TaxID=1890683 RepID=A0A427YBY1_9TREE|nr:hypothetical protein EHS25_002819 [Saitozyma podzolica]